MLKDHVVLITGAASGIGLAASRLFIQEESNVIGVDMDQESLNEASRTLGKRFIPRKCDITIESQIEAVAKFTEEKHGRLDTLVNNAGRGTLVNMETMLEKDFYWHYDADVKGPMLMVKHFIPLLRKSSNASIVNISSSAARVEHTKSHFLYSTAKAALLKFTQHIVRDNPGIRANSILPGWVDTPIYSRAGIDDATIKAIYERAVKFVPANRIGTPDDIAHTIVFLSTDKASYINGASIDINGGFLANADWGFLF